MMAEMELKPRQPDSSARTLNHVTHCLSKDNKIIKLLVPAFKLFRLFYKGSESINTLIIRISYGFFGRNRILHLECILFEYS